MLRGHGSDGFVCQKHGQDEIQWAEYLRTAGRHEAEWSMYLFSQKQPEVAPVKPLEPHTFGGLLSDT